MSASVVRLMVGLPVAALFPLGIPGLRDDARVHVGSGLVFGAFILAPAFPGWRSWVLLALTAAVTLGIRTWLGPSSGAAAETPWIRTMFAPRHALVPALVLALAAAVGLIAGAGTLGGYLSSLFHNDRIALVCSGALTSVFLGGAVSSTSSCPRLPRRIR